VDVLVNTTKTASSQPENSISKIVLEHILVLAAAQEVNRDETKPKVVNAVTLEVTPDQAERIDLARSVGTLSLVLRNPVDGDAVASLGVTKQQLLDPAAQLGAPPPTAVVHARRIAPTGPPADRIEVIRGTQRNAQEF
jgi:pilus assembly protein CpaB